MPKIVWDAIVSRFEAAFDEAYALKTNKAYFDSVNLVISISYRIYVPVNFKPTDC